MILWVDDGVVGYKCKCGEELFLDGGEKADKIYNCACGNKYKLIYKVNVILINEEK